MFKVHSDIFIYIYLYWPLCSGTRTRVRSSEDKASAHGTPALTTESGPVGDGVHTDVHVSVSKAQHTGCCPPVFVCVCVCVECLQDEKHCEPLSPLSQSVTVTQT